MQPQYILYLILYYVFNVLSNKVLFRLFKNTAFARKTSTETIISNYF